MLASGCAAARSDVIATESATIPTMAPEADSTGPPVLPDERQSPIEPAPEPVISAPVSSEQLSDEEVAEILADLAEQGFCDPADIEDEGVVTAMHFVVGGLLQDPCYVDQLDDGRGHHGGKGQRQHQAR